MKLKRLYDDPQSATPKVVGVRVVSTGRDKNLSTDLVQAGLVQGWISMAKGQLTIHGENAEITYNVRRGPGYFCCHCGVDMPDAGDWVVPGVQTKGSKHVADEHPGKPSPDQGNPAGYEKLNHFDCEQVAVELKVKE